MGTIETLMTLFDKGKEFYNENEEEFEELRDTISADTGKADIFDMTKPVNTVNVEDEEIHISVDFGGGGFINVATSYDEDGNILSVTNGRSETKFKLLDDAIVNQMKETRKNGVVDIIIPRGE